MIKIKIKFIQKIYILQILKIFNLILFIKIFIFLTALFFKNFKN